MAPPRATFVASLSLLCLSANREGIAQPMHGDDACHAAAQPPTHTGDQHVHGTVAAHSVPATDGLTDAGAVAGLADGGGQADQQPGLGG